MRDHNIEWSSVNKNIMGKRLNSELRSLNFRIMNEGLSFDLKFTFKKEKKSTFCKIKNRNHGFYFFVCTKHLFLECEFTI